MAVSTWWSSHQQHINFSFISTGGLYVKIINQGGGAHASGEGARTPASCVCRRAALRQTHDAGVGAMAAGRERGSRFYIESEKQNTFLVCAEQVSRHRQ